MTRVLSQSPAAKRKRASRKGIAKRQAEALAALKAQGKPVTRELELSPYQSDMVDFMCRVRGGHAEPYSFGEYVATLVRQDYERFQAQWAEVEQSTCDNCHRRLPLGCGGNLKHESACFHYGRIRALEL